MERESHRVLVPFERATAGERHTYKDREGERKTDTRDICIRRVGVAVFLRIPKTKRHIRFFFPLKSSILLFLPFDEYELLCNDSFKVERGTPSARTEFDNGVQTFNLLLEARVTFTERNVHLIQVR